MKLIQLLFIVAITSSCALDIDYHMPINRFDTPEVSGEFLGGKVEVNLATTHKVTLGEIWGDSVFGTGSHVDKDQYLTTTVSANLAGDLGVVSWLDFFYRANYDSTDIFGVKAQVYGEGRSAKKVGWKIAITAGMGSEVLDEDGIDVESDDGSETAQIESKLNTKAYDSSVILGYRVRPDVIFYLNNYYTHYQVYGHVVSSDGARIDAKGLSRNYGSLLGLRQGEDGYFVIEGGYSQGTFEDIKLVQWAFGVSAGYSW